MVEVAFPPSFEIAVYLQPPFNGPADTTCSWGVVSSHRGDVRGCPANTAPIRPPERILGANATLPENSTSLLNLASPWNETGNHTGVAGSDLPFRPIAARKRCTESSAGQMTCLGIG